ncbi:BMP-binding endothelial regulator protein-like [Saccoglossus kowalevskii]|uniref:IgGFc-binding protein-like n=1 Tax=Saccoglossus kowalevskii TaxID=10224 RepID=A0ABM0M2B5_SACKO|nr:PREDICTED: IgGFc-binding protein-like [Saccoglossus kowalevskii]
MSFVVLRCVLVAASLTLTTCSEDGLSKWIFPKQTRAEPACPATEYAASVMTEQNTVINAMCRASCQDTETEICDMDINALPCGTADEELGCKSCARNNDLEIQQTSGFDICNWFCHTECRSYGGTCRLLKCDDNERLGYIGTCPLPWLCKCCKPSQGYPGPSKSPGEQGDPQFRTFDGFHFMYNGHSDCEYVFFQECVPRPSFSVLIRHQYLENAMKMVVTEVSIIHNGDRVTLIEDRLYINGKIHNLLSPLKLGNLTVTRDNAGYVRAKLDYTFTLTWNGKGRVAPVLNQSIFGKVCGLMGNADGDPSNDMQVPMPDGKLKLVTESDDFGDKWIVPGSCSI